MSGQSYAARLDAQIEQYRKVGNIHDLPDIFHYWSNKHLRPRLNAVLGVDSVPEFYERSFAEALARCPSQRLLSIGAGDCWLEIEVTRRLGDAGVDDFSLHCLELSPHLIERARAAIAAQGLSSRIQVQQADINRWRPDGRYAAVMANHSLHHLVELEHVFAAVHECLDDAGLFVSNDMIGRNGHMRWPEVLEIVEGLWAFMPEHYKLNRQADRFDAQFVNWDCSGDGFEGIRAQDILPLLTQRFGFSAFLAFGGVVDVFVDRGYGHNFDPDSERDRAFVDFLQLLDDRLIDGGRTKPTTMFAVMCKDRRARPKCWRHWDPNFSLRPANS
jgi:SAM-dependent methyltransferase